MVSTIENAMVKKLLFLPWSDSKTNVCICHVNMETHDGMDTTSIQMLPCQLRKRIAMVTWENKHKKCKLFTLIWHGTKQKLHDALTKTWKSLLPSILRMSPLWHFSTLFCQGNYCCMACPILNEFFHIVNMNCKG